MLDLDFTGQTLDGKYRLERELGRGGMGTVYLATHLGTERPVAVKIIAPQFMKRAEFVERFRREARAAGRLRHPNVVDVTDFGFAESSDGQVAYLVMEYLDGCTLGEILEEENNLPVGWTLDILEQVCSAVQEAHEQGIIHRDLKPDNIWLEPNQRGGYTVKVLDFGIAKLEEHLEGESEFAHRNHASLPTYATTGRVTFSGLPIDGTIAGDGMSTMVSEAATIARTANRGATRVSDTGTVHIEPLESESKTAILEDCDRANIDQETVGTQVLSEKAATGRSGEQPHTTGNSLLHAPTTAGLTRVGAVLGTPLYMSPEQCRGEHLDPRSDIYSLGVIAYQMLSGHTPFSGDFKEVMEAQKTLEPAPLHAKKARRKLRKCIHSALHKNPECRPQTAEAFASEMRSRSEGIWALLRRSMTIYTEHLPKFVMLSAFFSLPMVVLTLTLLAFSYLKVSEAISDVTAGVTIGTTGLVLALISPFCANLIIGTIAWIVIQYLAVPLRPVKLRPALSEARRKWKRIAGAGLLTAFLPVFSGVLVGAVGFGIFALLGLLVKAVTGLSGVAPIMGGLGGVIVGFLAFFVVYISCILVAPVVMMENRKIIDSIRRSRALIKRSFWTSFGAVCILFFLPLVLAGSISYVVNVSAKAYDPATRPASEVAKTQDASVDATAQNPDQQAPEDRRIGPDGQPVEPDKSRRTPNLGWVFGRRGFALSGGRSMDMQSKVKFAVLESINQILWLPFQILVFSFSGIIVALLYLKTRLAGGESMTDLLEKFEDDEGPRKKWQERVRQRLIQSGRIPSKS